MFSRGIRVLAARLRGLLDRRRAEAEAAEELEAHIALHIAENLRAGMSPAEARRQALVRLGGMEAAKEACRDQWGWPWVEALARDLRQATRQVRRHPGYAAVVVVILTLGIGANVAIFSLIDALLVRPLPVPAASRLVRFDWSSRRQSRLRDFSSYGDCGASSSTCGCTFSFPLFQALATDQRDFAGMFATGGMAQLRVGAGGHTTLAFARFATGQFFSALGVEPALGRLFGPEDDRVGAPPVAVLSYGYWRSRFGGDRGIIGRTVSLDEHPVMVIGVAARDFYGLLPGLAENLWLPLSDAVNIGGVNAVGASGPAWLGPQDYWLEVVGRLRPGRSAGQAQADESARFEIAAERGSPPVFTTANPPILGVTSATHGLGSLGNGLSQPLDLLMAVVGLILLLACANIAGLALAQGDGRRREMALRLALGAGRGRIFQQLLAESVLLAIAGGIVAIGVAWAAAAALVGFLSQDSPFPVHLTVAPDPRVLAFTATVAIGVGIVFGLLPALRLADRRLEPAIRSGGAAIAGRPRRRLGRHGAAGGLVVAQVALAVVVAAGAGLLLRTLSNLETRNPGFNTRDLLLFSVDLSQSRLTPAQRASLISSLRGRLASLPGVTAASFSSTALLDGSFSIGPVRLKADGKGAGEAQTLSIGPDYFATMGIPVLAGRRVRAGDLAAAGYLPRVVVVNQALAKKYFPRGNALGSAVWSGGAKPEPMRIIAVVGDTLYYQMRGPMKPAIYYPSQRNEVYFVLRTAVPPEALIPEVRKFMMRAAPQLPLFDLHTQRQMIARTLVSERLLTDLLSLFALMALALAAIGLFGLLAYEVGRRRREIGLRMAVGARAGQVLGSVLGEGAVLAAVGVAIGLAMAGGLTRYLRTLLYGVRPNDPLSLAAAAVVLLATAELAAWVPARRAASVDPWQALREE
ncbi:MAG: ADOP family duplicated permease [Terriglobales bacterium]